MSLYRPQLRRLLSPVPEASNSPTVITSRCISHSELQNTSPASMRISKSDGDTFIIENKTSEKEPVARPSSITASSTRKV
mmetsp:Transcript_10829/g.16117  ORF Transcript_10829/g.16117 Transcript_10829/m.16117 type:complete len:80 (-) Transcript_10829:789-1028(-)